MDLVLGLDIGIASVGWGIINKDTGKVIDAGVRLFPEASKINNENRRSFRGSRRLKRRCFNRKKDLIEILNENNLYEDDHNNMINPYEARVKALNNKVSKAELTKALINICKHRGSSLEIIEDDEAKAKDNETTKKTLQENDAALKNKYICEVQLERLNNNGKLRGTNNNFRTVDYTKELTKILNTQAVDKRIADLIVNCIIRRRHFDEGPGSFKSQTKYGRVYNDDGTVKIGMIEKMTGKCSVFKDELRAPKFAPSAEMFNLLNDLNNLRINDERLDIATKQALINKAVEKCQLTANQIASFVGVDLEDIQGFRIDKSNKQLVTPLQGYKKLVTILKKHDLEECIKEYELLDNIAVILTKTKAVADRQKQLKELNQNFNDELIKELSETNKFVGYHSLSLKAIYLLNKELYETDNNQMEILSLSNLVNNGSVGSQKGKKRIGLDDNAILSPVAQRSYRQAIKVVNAIRSKYGELESIVVETTRDKNSQEEKKRINESQKYFENINKKVDEILKDYPEDIRTKGKVRTKIRLYLDQDGKTIYTQKPIDLNQLIVDDTAYEIDHILPVSISLDDSFNNKVLCSHSENQDKGQHTPIYAFENNLFSTGSLEQYKFFVKTLLSTKKISIKKYQYLTYQKDLRKYENMKEFIARNLVDTSYANRLVFNTLMNYFKDNQINTKVHTIKGLATSAFRKRIEESMGELAKDRDYYMHHAVDALIVASIKKFDLYNKLLKDFEIKNKEIIVNNTTGEVININEEDYFDSKYISLLKNIVSINPASIKYSYQVDRKPDRSVSDQTIYSTRNVEGKDIVVKKYKDIYSNDFYSLANDVVNKKAESKYLMCKNDKETYKKIEKVITHYFNEFKNESSKIKKNNKGEYEFKFNPLREHLDKTGEYITKYSRNNDGPKVTQIKYLDTVLNSHIDISKNYKTTDKKVVLLQISGFRTDFYIDNGVYKFITIRYKDVRFNGSKYYIEGETYKSLKEEKGISNEAKFVCSLNRNDFVEIKDQKSEGIFRFVGTNNDTNNIIEVKSIDHKDEKRIIRSITKNILLIKKHNYDAIGNLRNFDNNLKLVLN